MENMWQLILGQIDVQIGNKVQTLVHAQVKRDVHDRISVIIRDKVYDEVDAQVWNATEEGLRDQII